MVLLSVDFSNLHTILESLYNEMMPLCGDMLEVAKGLAGRRCPVLCGRPCLAVACPCRTDRRVSASAPVCDRHLHHVFSRLWYSER